MSAKVVVKTYKREGDRYVWEYHDPDDIIDYPLDFSQWLAHTGDGSDVIVAAETTLDPGLTEFLLDFDSAHATMWIRSGVLGRTLRAACQVTTLAGRKKTQSVFLRVKDT